MGTLLKTQITARGTSKLAAEVYLHNIIYDQCSREQIHRLCQLTIINATLRQKAEEELREL